MNAASPRWLVLVLVVTWLQLLSPAAGAEVLPECQDRGTGAAAPVKGAIFNDPAGTTEQHYRITGAVQSNVNGTPSGGVIRIATQRLDIESLLRALVRAHRCDVGVRVLVPGRAWRDPAVRRLRNELGTDTTARSWITSCVGACSEPGRDGIMHNKLYLFSRVVHAAGVAHDVTMYSSSNLVHNQATRRYNDAYQVVGHAAVHESARRYFADLTDGRDNAPTDRTTAPGFVQYWFPSTQDFHRELLERTTCRNADGPTSIRFASSIWKRHEIADQLVGLKRAGCRIRVVLSVDKVDKDVLRSLRRGRIPTHVQSMARGDQAMHNKYVAIRGGHGGGLVDTVYCGSLNVSRFSARVANNAMLRIVDDEVAYLAYRRHFNRIWDLGRPLRWSDVRSASRVDAVQAEKRS